MTSKGQRSNYGTQRNHIIPMSHMRNFARDIHDRDVVYLYDLEEAGREQSYSPQQLTVENAAVQRGFYTNEYESKLNEKYESPAVAAIKKLITGRTITSEERGSVAAYLMTYQVRSHSMLKYIHELYTQSSEEYINHIKETYSAIQETLINRGDQVDEELFAGIEGYEIGGNKYDEWGDRHFAEGRLSTLEGIKRATELLASLKWRIFTSDTQPFVLSDAFFTMEALDQPFYELYAPLGRNSCLFISRYIHDLNDRWNIERIPISQSNVRAINVRTVKKAEKYIVSGTDNLAWVKNARKTPDNAHGRITIPGFTNPRILNEFITERCPNCWYSLRDGGESEAFYTEVGEVTHGKVMINNFVQSKCSRCHFGTDFKNSTDRKDYTIGAPAAQIRNRLIPKPESTEARREDSGRVGEGATEEVAGLHLG